MTMTDEAATTSQAAIGPLRRAALRRVRALKGDSLFRNSAFLLVATVELTGGGFLFWQLVAHLFTPTEVGRASALISACALVANLALLGMHNSVIRYLHVWPDQAATMNTGLTVVTAAAAFGAVGFVVGSRWFAPQLGLLRHPADAVLFVLFAAALAVSLLNDNVFVALRRSGYIVGRNTVIVLLRLVLPFACVGFGAFGVFTAYQAAATAALLLYLVVLRRTLGLPSRLRARRTRLAAMWRYSAGNYVATAMLMIPTLIMPVLIAERVDAAHAAYYYIASMLTGVVTFVPQATSRSLFAEAAQDAAGLRASLSRVIRLTTVAEVPILLVLLGGGYFALALFGRVYTAAYPLLVLLTVNSALTSIGFVGSTLLMITGRLRLMCALSAVASTVTLTGAYLLVGRGIIWVGWSLIAGELILSAAYVVLVAAMVRPHGEQRLTARPAPVDPLVEALPPIRTSGEPLVTEERQGGNDEADLSERVLTRPLREMGQLQRQRLGVYERHESDIHPPREAVQRERAGGGEQKRTHTADATDGLSTRLESSEIRSAAYQLAASTARAGAELWRRRLIRSVVDETKLMSLRSTLVIAPHPDDETFGAGATIARCTAAGTPVTVAVATDGRHSTRSSVLTPDELAAIREQEVISACRALGVPESDVVRLGFEDGTLPDNFERLVGDLRTLLRELAPEQVLVPCAQDDHPDHVAVHHSLRQAVREARLDCAVVAYPVWAWARGPWFLDVPMPTRLSLLAWAGRQMVFGNPSVSVSTAGYLDAKRAALCAHASQTTNLTGEPTWQYLHPDFCALFLRKAEIFIHVD